MEDALNDRAASGAPGLEAYKPDLEKLKKMLSVHVSATQADREEAGVDIDLYDGNQLTREEREALKRRGQPDNVFNFTRKAVDGTLGVIKQGMTDPRAYPRNPSDQDSADTASKVLRYIADKSRFHATKIDVAWDYLVPGTGAVLIEADDDGNPTIARIRWEEFVWDPYSRAQDFSDARYLGVARWTHADDVAALYPDKTDEIEACVADTSLGLGVEAFSDRPDNAGLAWVDHKQRRILVVDLYHREGGRWRRCVFHAGGALEAGDSPYTDDKGRPCCPIEAQSCYVLKSNGRTGIVRDMRGPQFEINKRHSKALFFLSARQLQETAPGMGQGTYDQAVAEAAKPNGVIPSGWGVVPTGDLAQGQVQLLQEAKRLLERFSPNPAMLGRAGVDLSGRAKQIDQQAGLVELAVVFGGIEEWERRVYRACWNRARQFMTAPAWVRITDDEGAPQFVGVNQPVMAREPEVYWDEGRGAMGVRDVPVVLGYRNRLAELDVDITVDSVPDTANLQAEQFGGIL